MTNMQLHLCQQDKSCSANAQGVNLVAAAKPLFTVGLAKWSLRLAMGPCMQQIYCQIAFSVACFP